MDADNTTRPLKKRGRKKKVISLNNGSFADGSVSFNTCPGPDPCTSQVCAGSSDGQDGLTVQFGMLNIQVAGNQKEIPDVKLPTQQSKPPVDLPDFMQSTPGPSQCDHIKLGLTVNRIHGSPMCWNCSGPVNQSCPVQKVMPVKYNTTTGQFMYEGVFCCWECVKRFSIDRRDCRCSERTQLIAMLLRRIYGGMVPLRTAPPRFALQSHGGQMSAEEFAEHCSDLRNTRKPLKSCIFNNNILTIGSQASG